MTCPHTDLMFNAPDQQYPVCTLCGNSVRIIALTPLHPFDGPRGLVGYTRVTDTDGDIVQVQESSAVHIGSTKGGFWDGPFCWLRATDDGSAHLTPTMAREIGLALIMFAEDHDE